jgi:hypothetical protein
MSNTNEFITRGKITGSILFLIFSLISSWFGLTASSIMSVAFALGLLLTILFGEKK